MTNPCDRSVKYRIVSMEKAGGMVWGVIVKTLMC